VLAPAGTPAPIVARYNEVLNAILAEPNVRELLEKQGLVPHRGAPAALAELIAKDRTRWAGVVKRAGITPD
jgi:tripartite-type tricarboxylate transporter receptor subunit TctC